MLRAGIADTPVNAIFAQYFSRRIGLLVTPDLIGLGTILRSLEMVQQSYSDDDYSPISLFRHMANTGLLGRKWGKDFFEYGRRETSG